MRFDTYTACATQKRHTKDTKNEQFCRAERAWEYRRPDSFPGPVDRMVKKHRKHTEKRKGEKVIMYQDGERKSPRMRGLTYLQARPRCSYFARKTRYDSLRRSSGFTLIEILIVVVIIAIAAMTAIPMMTSAGSVQIKSAANMIAADLEYAKSMAISRGQVFSVVFDKSTDSYSIKDQAGNVISHPVKKGFDYVISLRDKGLDKVDIADVDFNGTSTVKFDYLGSPYDAGTSPLNRGVIKLQAGSITITITVEPVTGFISITD